jgi:2-keto-4-pentenoate hydratase/2-oxohepta-3-ene-1,7-dioic acid hydratase in catechol pathway
MSVFARVLFDTNRVSFARIDGQTLVLLARAPWEGIAETGEVVALAASRLLAPVVPSKVVCVGRNYLAHARELGNDAPAEPLLFFKPPSAVCGPGDPIELPPESERVDHEAELGVVIGARCRRVTAEQALSLVFGYTCVNDVTARDLQKRDGQWARAKGFDTFCPVGPVIVSGLDPQALRVRGRVDGATRQDGQTADMIFTVARLIAYISRIMTLEPGDIIATGTPEGVGPLAQGNTVEIEIDGVGVLGNPVCVAPGR